MNVLPEVDGGKPEWTVGKGQDVGVCYVATGKEFLEEAEHAVQSVRRTNPDLKCCLITDQVDADEEIWDHLVPVRGPDFSFRDKILMGLCPYERFLYLDTDTRVIGALDDIFLFLESFDLCGHQLFEGNDVPQEGVSKAFCEFNGGVLGFRRSAQIEKFFHDWMEAYDKFRALNTEDFYDPSNVSDQKTLRHTAYFSNLRIGTLGPEYDFVPSKTNFACKEVVIFHGRNEKALDDLEGRINLFLGNRVYLPRFDAIIGDETPLNELLRLCRGAFFQTSRALGRKILPRSILCYLHRFTKLRAFFVENRFSELNPDNAKKWKRPD